MNIKVLLSLGFLLGVCIHATNAWTREGALEEKNRNYRVEQKEEVVEGRTKKGWWAELRRNQRVENREEEDEDRAEEGQEKKECATNRRGNWGCKLAGKGKELNLKQKDFIPCRGRIPATL